MRKSNSVQKNGSKYHGFRNTGKHDFLKFAMFFFYFEKVKLTNHSTYEPVFFRASA